MTTKVKILAPSQAYNIVTEIGDTTQTQAEHHAYCVSSVGGQEMRYNISTEEIWEGFLEMVAFGIVLKDE